MFVTRCQHPTFNGQCHWQNILRPYTWWNSWHQSSPICKYMYLPVIIAPWLKLLILSYLILGDRSRHRSLELKAVNGVTMNVVFIVLEDYQFIISSQEYVDVYKCICFVYMPSRWYQSHILVCLGHSISCSSRIVYVAL